MRKIERRLPMNRGTSNIEHRTSNESKEPSPHPDRRGLCFPYNPHPALSRHPLPLLRARESLPSHQNGSGEGTASGQHSYSEARGASAGSWSQCSLCLVTSTNPPTQSRPPRSLPPLPAVAFGKGGALSALFSRPNGAHNFYFLLGHSGYHHPPLLKNRRMRFGNELNKNLCH